MTRYTILVPQVSLTTGGANNMGSPCLMLSKGKIKAVQFSMVGVTDVGTGGDAQTLIQVGKSATYSAPIPFNGWNPQEIAAALVGYENDDTATTARLVTTDAQLTVAADSPVEVGEQFFINAVDMGGAAQVGLLSGFVVLYVE